MESSVKDINIRELCELCKSMPCCPEHCCDWDSCQCSHCNSRRNNVHLQTGIGYQQQNADPSILIISTGTEEVKKVKKQKTSQKDSQKQLQTDQQQDQQKGSDKDKELHLPSEQIRASDGALIINYEVVIEEEEDKVTYSGGVRGIRALRQQRDQLNHQIEDDLQEKSKTKFVNRFDSQQNNANQYEEESKR